MIRLDTLAILFGITTSAISDVGKNESLIDPTIADMGVIVGTIIGLLGVGSKIYEVHGVKKARTRELDLRERELVFKENGNKHKQD